MAAGERPHSVGHKILVVLEYIELILLIPTMIIVLIQDFISDYLHELAVKSALRERAHQKAWVRQLAQQARWRHCAGASTWHEQEGRQAWTRLIAVGDSADRDHPWTQARAVVRESWLEHPDDEGWAALTRWDARNGAAGLLRIVTDRQDGGNPAALAAACARLELTSGPAAERVRFYLLTGQRERRRALDPQGSLLAGLYWRAPVDGDERERLWAVLMASEDLDGMCAIVAAGDGMPGLSAAERRRVLEQHRALGDWDNLWRQAQTMSLLDALAALAMVAPGWRPGGESGLPLFALLRAADRTAARTGRSVLSKARAESMRALRRLANQPMPAWRPADLDTALAAARDLDRYPDVRPLCELMIRCLECRFGDDVPATASASPSQPEDSGPLAPSECGWRSTIVR